MNMEQAYSEYLDLQANNSECIKDWNKLEQAPVIDSFDPYAAMPAKYTLPLRATMIGRTRTEMIEKKYWNGFRDPAYPELFYKQKLVEEYFTVGVHFINTDSSCTESVPAGAATATMTTVEVQSSISIALETTFSIKSTLEGQYGTETAYVKASLEAAYAIRNATTESSSRLERKDTKIEIGAEKYDRLFVQWLFSTAVALYRKKKATGAVELVAVSEWPIEVIGKAYAPGS